MTLASPVRSSRGSSPLTRGKLEESTGDLLTTGLIPAHAGKTASSKSHWQRTRAHPRSRGENPGAVLVLILHQGSSPLTRGKQAGGPPDVGEHRLIPAHAGKTTLSQVGGYPSGAHPRSRGENAARPALRIWRGGSSPLTRGKPHLVDLDHESQGLIPAHAGKTAPEGRTESLPRAHPRSRGENTGVSSASVAVGGSSPLTRGKLEVSDRAGYETGLIPAHAGKTPAFSWASRGAWAHPRSRGENPRGR